jgi:hypothetical protein
LSFLLTQIGEPKAIKLNYFNLKATERRKGSRKGVELERAKQKPQIVRVAIFKLDARPIEV